MHYRPVCYFKTRIKYLYGTVQNAHLYLIGNLSNCSGQKSTKFSGGGGESGRYSYVSRSKEQNYDFDLSVLRFPKGGVKIPASVSHES
jgi:hypothetical protein